jgi:hypothetical protein
MITRVFVEVCQETPEMLAVYCLNRLDANRPEVLPQLA